MSFTDQKQRIATAEECRADWGCAKNGERFRCYLCGHRFKPGDKWRWVYTAGRGFMTEDGRRFGVTNLMTCDDCDGDDVVDRWAARNAEFYSARFWALR